MNAFTASIIILAEKKKFCNVNVDAKFYARKAVKCKFLFTSQQIENYRKSVKQPNMSESKVMEEMLADAFADMKTGRRIIEKI